jgi:hypothetical protein
MRGLNHRGRKREQLRICGIEEGCQLIVPRLELGIAQGSSCVGRSATLGPQTLQSRVDYTELAL